MFLMLQVQLTEIFRMYAAFDKPRDMLTSFLITSIQTILSKKISTCFILGGSMAV